MSNAHAALRRKGSCAERSSFRTGLCVLCTLVVPNPQSRENAVIEGGDLRWRAPCSRLHEILRTSRATSPERSNMDRLTATLARYVAVPVLVVLSASRGRRATGAPTTPVVG